MKLRQQKAFTLIETLIALTLMGLLIMVLFGGFRAGVRSWEMSENHVELTEEPRQLSALLYRHLGQIADLSVDAASFEPQKAFAGKAEQIRYVAPLSMSVGNKYYLFEMINNHEGRGGIWIRFAPFVNRQTAAGMFVGSQFMQISRDWSVHFSYYLEEEWLDVLPEGKLPQLVAAQLTANDRQWPSMVFAINTLGLK